jgi:predicted O-linked N-acetylglucosamine transferase (SPINDLY family)
MSTDILRRCAALYAEDLMPSMVRPDSRGGHWPHGAGRIRVAYVSADFHTHATSWLMAGMFEAHDRDRFDIYAFLARAK